MKALILALLVVLLGGCATGYQAKGLAGGYTDRMIGPDTAVVKFNGNAYTDPDLVFIYTARRAAELTLKQGHTHFIVLAIADRGKNVPVYSPSTSTTTGTMFAPGVGAIPYTTTTTTPGFRSMFKPGVAATIRMTDDPGDGAYEAAAVLEWAAAQEAVRQ